MFARYIIYGPPIFGSTTNDNLVQIQRIQIIALNNLYEKDQYFSPRKLFEDFGCLAIMDTYKLFACSNIQVIKMKKIMSTRNRNNL